MRRRFLSLPGTLLVAALVLAGGCSKSPTKPAPTPQPLPNDPNATAPPLTCTNHFDADTTWVQIVPTTDDVEIQSVRLGIELQAGYPYVEPTTELVGFPIVKRFGAGYITVPGAHGLRPTAVYLQLSIRRTQYRTWFRVQVE